jgi:predicted membrane protein
MNELFALTRHRKPFRTLALCACVFGLCILATAKQPTIITFDPPGSVSTNVEQINLWGIIIGWYLDANSVVHGFWRTANGKIVSYDAPGAGTGAFQGTFVISINDSGTSAGMYVDTNDVFHGFLRTAEGKYTTFDVPNAGTDAYQGTVVWDINNAGAIAGTYVNTGQYSPFQQTQVWRGYVRAADGTVTEFDAPGAGSGPTQGTLPCSVDCLNPPGTIAGAYTDATNITHGFIRSKGGDITEFDPPGANYSTASGIDPDGDVVGYYTDSDGVYHSFLRDPHGHFTDINVEGAGTGSGQGTLLENTAQNGAIAGYYVDANAVYHGFVGTPNGKITTFDVPAAGTGAGQGTLGGFPTPSGSVTGNYIDGSNAQHGYLWIPRDDEHQ